MAKKQSSLKKPAKASGTAGRSQRSIGKSRCMFCGLLCEGIAGALRVKLAMLP